MPDIACAVSWSAVSSFCQAAGRNLTAFSKPATQISQRTSLCRFIAANARQGKNAPPISPIALEAVKRIDALFGIEREINGLSVEKRLAARRERSAAIWFSSLRRYLR
jgi:hypothetical protein